MTSQQRRFVLPVRPTPGCPSMRRLDSATERRTWAPHERDHVRACEFCQRIIGYSWDDGCPELDELLAYAESPKSYQDGLAMAFHLDTRHCKRCNRLMTSKAFVQCLSFHRPAPAQMPPLAPGYARLILHGEVPSIAAAGPAESHRVEAPMAKDALGMESVLFDGGHIVARVLTKDASLAGREVMLALSTPDRTLTATSPLVRRGRSFVAETTFALDAVPADYILEGTLLPGATPATPEMTAALAEACRNQDASVRWEAARAIAAMGAAAAAPAILEILAAMAADPDEDVRAEAARALLQALSRMIQDADERVSVAVARTPERL